MDRHKYIILFDFLLCSLFVFYFSCLFYSPSSILLLLLTYYLYYFVLFIEGLTLYTLLLSTCKCYLASLTVVHFCFCTIIKKLKTEEKSVMFTYIIMLFTHVVPALCSFVWIYIYICYYFPLAWRTLSFLISFLAIFLAFVCLKNYILSPRLWRIFLLACPGLQFFLSSL